MGNTNSRSGHRGRRSNLAKYEGKICHYCRRELVIRNPKNPNPALGSTVDHVIPYKIAKTSDLRNLVLCCHACNQAKGNMSYFDYCELIGRKPDMKKFCMALNSLMYPMDHSVHNCGRKIDYLWEFSDKVKI